MEEKQYHNFKVGDEIFYHEGIYSDTIPTVATVIRTTKTKVVLNNKREVGRDDFRWGKVRIATERDKQEARNYRIVSKALIMARELKRENLTVEVAEKLIRLLTPNF